VVDKPGMNIDVQVKDLAKNPTHIPIKLKFSGDRPIMELVLPGGTVEFGLSGELVLLRTDSAQISVTAKGEISADYAHSQRVWGKERGLDLINGFGFKVTSEGKFEVTAKVALESPWYKGTFSVSPDGGLKYEVKPRDIKFKGKDFIAKGNIGCWIKMKVRFELPPTEKVPTRPLFTLPNFEQWVQVILDPKNAIALSVTAVTAITFWKLLELVMNGLTHAAGMFIIIIVPAKLRTDDFEHMT
jgi:hypothetical protein